jgi:hypothetical protein
MFHRVAFRKRDAQRVRIGPDWRRRDAIEQGLAPERDVVREARVEHGVSLRRK